MHITLKGKLIVTASTSKEMGLFDSIRVFLSIGNVTGYICISFTLSVLINKFLLFFNM